MYISQKLGVSSIIFILIVLITQTSATDTMTLQVTVHDNGSPSDSNSSDSVSIQVPDFIDLGTIDEDGVSEELKIYVNNTGNTGITITPTLQSYSDEIFTNLYFREFKTSGGAPVPQRRIGSWSCNISAPASGSTVRAKYFYMQLDLSDADIDLSSDLIGHQANVKFIATAL